MVTSIPLSGNGFPFLEDILYGFWLAKWLSK
jgi:hypothetical protein